MPPSVSGAESGHPEFKAHGLKCAGIGDGCLARKRGGSTRKAVGADQLQRVAGTNTRAVIGDTQGGRAAHKLIGPRRVAAADYGAIGKGVFQQRGCERGGN